MRGYRQGCGGEDEGVMEGKHGKITMETSPFAHLPSPSSLSPLPPLSTWDGQQHQPPPAPVAAPAAARASSTAAPPAACACPGAIPTHSLLTPRLPRTTPHASATHTNHLPLFPSPNPLFPPTWQGWKHQPPRRPRCRPCLLRRGPPCRLRLPLHQAPLPHVPQLPLPRDIRLGL